MAMRNFDGKPFIMKRNATISFYKIWNFSSIFWIVTICGISLAAMETVAEQQACSITEVKHTFPNIGYALLGYNIYRGYPLAVGHDPGLTRPVFIHDYCNGSRTADYRYVVPKGFMALPDIACVTSFTSEVVRNSNQLSKALSAHVEASGGGWGLSFSASADYKKTSSEIHSRNSIFIHSKAKCDYYYVMMNKIVPPKLSPDFIKFVEKLAINEDGSGSGSKNEDKEMFNLFETFGTHFMEEVTFGAKFMYEHKVTQSQEASLKSESFSLSVQASYAGAFDFSAGIGMSNEQQSAAECFRNKAETKTISVGGPPPANGDTMTWASNIKENPIPTKYKLVSIEELFTERFMGGTSIGRAQFESLSGRISAAKFEYCTKHLLLREDVEYCGDINDYIEYDSNGAHYVVPQSEYFIDIQDPEKCKEVCPSLSCIVMQNITSAAAINGERTAACISLDIGQYTSGNSRYNKGQAKAFLKHAHGETGKLFLNKLLCLKKEFVFPNVAVKDSSPRETAAVTTEQQCKDECKKVPGTVCTLISSSEGEKTCALHDMYSVKKIEFRRGSSFIVVPQ